MSRFLKNLDHRSVQASMQNRSLDRMIAELSSHMTEFELDACIDVLHTLADSKFDVNLTVDDAAAQLRLVLGQTRYEEIKGSWCSKNQHLIQRDDCRERWRHIKTGQLFDGLDPEDDYREYELVRM